ncbi:hypothetical protein [uncultured Enterococcus sp.]|uniref:hypothetical protein n=1 Tax=uncultured Enterococcus sp. TaxID=167972 RepID=UPI002AA647C7|nr:hypothetical protein [uncultured Enterococcus sp.]
MTGNVSSSTGAAQQAVSKLSGNGVDVSTQEITFSGSDVSSMTDGLAVANQVVGEVRSLAECVRSQAQKFPQIAETMALKDREAAHQAGGVIY